jgi:hypothetical protein
LINNSAEEDALREMLSEFFTLWALRQQRPAALTIVSKSGAALARELPGYYRSISFQGVKSMLNIRAFPILAGAAIAVCALVARPADAVPFSVTGSDSNGPLAATANITTGAGTVTVSLANNLSAATIISPGQTVSDLSFALSNAPGTNTSNSAAGQLANIGAGGSVTNVSGTPTRWLGVGGGNFSIVGNTITLETIGGGQPSQLLLPAGSSFPAGNGGLTGGQFNPYVVGPETFTLNLTGVTAATTVIPSSVTFSFGTGPDTFISVPAPMIGHGLLVLLAVGGVLFGGKLVENLKNRRLHAA